MKKQLIFIILSFLCLAAQSVKADFRKADMDGWNIKTNSALDLSFLLEAGPAGKHGFLRDNRKGGVEFEHLPGVPQRFNGFNTMLLHFNSTLKKEKISELSQRIRRSGYNCIRLNIPYNSDFKNARGEVFLAPEKLDFMDYYIAEMKRNGIYIQFILGIGSFGKETNKYAWINISNLKLRMFLGDPEVRNFYRELNTLLLNHINPYTGIAYKDDPVFLSMECYNEQELGIERWQSAPPELRNEFLSRFKAFRKTRTLRGIQETEDAAFTAFRMELETETILWFRKVLRDIGWKGLITQYNYSKRLAESAIRFRESDLLTFNTYFCHPGGNWSNGTGHILQHSSIGTGALYMRNMAGSRLNGRPFLITEHNHCFWNPYQYEDALLFPSYASFQNFSAVFVHERLSGLIPRNPVLTPFAVDPNPVSRANELLNALIFLRRDAAPARHQIQVSVSERFFHKNASGAVSSNQTLLSLLCGFSIDFPDLQTRYPKQRADYRLPAADASGIFIDPWFSDVADSKNNTFPLEGAIAELRKNKILPEGNRTDMRKSVFESDTGEILLKRQEKELILQTSRTEGIAAPAGTSKELSVLSIGKLPCNATAAITSLDGKPLEKSRHMLLCLITRAINSGMEWKDGGKRLKKLGTIPVLLQTGRFSLTLQRNDFSSVTLYPLSINGIRRAPLLPSPNGNGWKWIIDTATLPDGTTPFFEIIRENKP